MPCAARRAAPCAPRWPTNGSRAAGWPGKEDAYVAYLLERHKVRDYDRWREVFDADAGGREAAGCRGARVFRNADDPEEVVVLFEWDDPGKARDRVGSATLGRKFDEAGVSGGIGRTEFCLLEEEPGSPT
jgi:quinol monooxygenase YgiN